ncbi:MAG TPA: cysteine desulfurase family protein [Chitinophagales bacterium]|nr:cysteine desulfurase family protein [Chitinophagales bacterium]
MKVYLDNAATTRLAPEVLDEMMPYLTEHYGNPSSIHGFGRKTKAAIEKARKIIAGYLNASTAEVFFTSCGTESNNMIIKGAVRDLGVKRIISSRIEHHCVLHSVETMERVGVQVDYVELDGMGHIDYAHLERLLAQGTDKTLVTLMHANNEIGTLLDLERVSALCIKYGALFHSDTVQTIGYFPFDLQKTKIHFLTGSAHKLHGPKGIGFAYINSENTIKPYIEGGAQERNMRAGTENVYGIIGFGKALELAAAYMAENREYISGLKAYMFERLNVEIPGIEYNGNPGSNGNYKVLNVSLPPNEKSELALFNLDIAGIAASGGSACSSGSEKGSHVLEGIKADPQRKSVRFSFSKYNTKEEIDYAVATLKEMFEPARKNTLVQ